MEHKIVGTTMPVLEISLAPGDSIISEAGELSWMTASIELSTSTGFGGGGGVLGAFKRAASGGTLFMQQFRANSRAGMVAFATKVPGAILPVPLSGRETYMVHRHGFLAGTEGVELSIGFQRSLGAGIFGGDGFRLQRIAGQGTAWIELDGEVITYDLAPGETLRVHPGHVGMFQDSVSFDITRIKGIKNMLFGADGIFLAELTGPGRVWLQSLPLPNLAHAISHYITATGGEQAAGAGAIAAGVLKGLSR